MSINFTSCSAGVFDCFYNDYSPEDSSVCANYNGNYQNMEGTEWIVVIAALLMCAMSFGIGANDAANSWGSSVGSGALSLKTAVLIGGVMEFIGAVTLGNGVSNTIKNSISDIEDENCWACGYCNSEISVYQGGMFGTLFSTAIFLLVTSLTSLPVSATHAVVGGVAGMTLGAVGANCIDWSFEGLGAVMASWVISPLLAGIVSVGLYVFSQKFITKSSNPRRNALRAVPAFVFLMTMVISGLTCLKTPLLKDLSEKYHLIIVFVSSFVSLFLAYVFLMPWIHKNMPSAGNENTPLRQNDESSDSQKQVQDQHFSIERIDPNKKASIEAKDTLFCFRVLLVLNAALESFAHGANDTANAAGPFSAVYTVYQSGLDACADDAEHSNVWIMALAGLFVAVGVITLGYKVIETIGKNLTSIDFEKGFCIELSSVSTVLLATMFELPVSTTHCQIGAVVAAGWYSGGAESVKWALFARIGLAWVLTIPFSGLISFVVMEIFRSVLKK